MHSNLDFEAAWAGGHALILEDLSESREKFALTVLQQVLLPLKESVEIGEILGNLLHPPRVGIGGNTRQVNPSALQLHDKQQVKRH